MPQCPTTQGRNNWRYNQDLRVLVHEVERQRKDAKNWNKNQCFYRFREKAKQQRRDMRISLREFLDQSQDWQLDRNLEKKLNFPVVVPNIVKKRSESSCWLGKEKGKICWAPVSWSQRQRLENMELSNGDWKQSMSCTVNANVLCTGGDRFIEKRVCFIISLSASVWKGSGSSFVSDF